MDYSPIIIGLKIFSKLFLFYEIPNIFLISSMKCWNSAFNAQGSRVNIVVVQLWTMKIYVSTSGNICIH